MKATTCFASAGTALFVLLTSIPANDPVARAGMKPEAYWNVDDLRPGMKGVGRTVMKGTKVEPFEAEVLGVMKNTSPGRDMVLCRLSGLNLDKTGVIAGMSGSPIYIDNKLMGAVAFAWPYGKEPIAGVTPFSQMHSYVEAFERRDLAEQGKATRVGLKAPVRAGGKSFDAVTVSQSFDTPASPKEEDGLFLVPLQTPLAASGFTPHTLSLLRDRVKGYGMLPMQGGAAPARVADEEKNAVLEPGGPLAVALITGDFDLSGIGTVTHVEGNRVYGWGHPFMGFGACEFPAMTGYIHTIYPRQTVSFKMGSPLKTVGVINADVSTGIAGWVGRKPDMLPVRMTVKNGSDEEAKTFNVEVARQRSMLANLVYTALTNSVDMEGDLPEEMTAEMTCRIEVEGRDPVVVQDTFSGSSYSGGRAPSALYNPIGSIIYQLTYNSYKPVRLKKVECETVLKPGRVSADIEAVELDSDTYAPGETVKATAFLRPYKGQRQRVPVSLKLPADLPEGIYSAQVCDDPSNARLDLRDNPTLYNPQNVDQIFAALKVQTDAKRTNLVLRVPVNAVGVALDGKSLPNLPPSMVAILGQSRRTGAQTMGGALVARRATEWVVQGSETVKFSVAKNKKTTETP
ncbi:MAG TPA: SpoIVB peptidase S55 domain-containing protein [Gemmataceae bacterium]|nr:SpoIVB peptidase S55 domain-containing protein [Gemmataceae bacterium]